MAPFFDKWQKAGGVFEGTASRTDLPARISPQNKLRINADAAIECINCAVCYSACDVVGWNDQYQGPAALNRVWTLVNDERQHNRQATLNHALSEGGCTSCHSQGNCTRYCPVGLNPSQSIASLKRAAFRGLKSID